MKTFRLLTGIIIATFVLFSASAAVIVPSQHSALPGTLQKGQLVKGIVRNGQIIPVVDLPEVEIRATKPGTYILAGVISDGTFIATVNLPMIEITAKKHQAQKYPAFVIGEEVTILADLPLIEIISDLPYHQLVSSWLHADNQYLVITLPEVVVTPVKSSHYLVNGLLSNGVVTPLVNLPTIEIESELALLVKENKQQANQAKRNAEWFFISLKHCSVGFGNQIVCELITQWQKGSNKLLLGNNEL